MEHYEIDMVRNRNVGPDLNLVFGINDRWETSMSNSARPAFGRSSSFFLNEVKRFKFIQVSRTLGTVLLIQR